MSVFVFEDAYGRTPHNAVITRAKITQELKDNVYDAVVYTRVGAAAACPQVDYMKEAIGKLILEDDLFDEAGDFKKKLTLHVPRAAKDVLHDAIHEVFLEQKSKSAVHKAREMALAKAIKILPDAPKKKRKLIGIL